MPHHRAFVAGLGLTGLLAGLGCGSQSVPATLSVDDVERRVTAGRVSESETREPLPSRTNAIGMTFVRIPAGTFTMGTNETGRFAPYSRVEGPAHPVEITRDFWLGRHEVTVGQYRRFVRATGYRTAAERDGMGCNGLNLRTGALVRRAEWVWTSPPYPQTEEHPVVCVDWDDAMAFCAWLGREHGRTCRLPTEAEWEYACRAGTTSLFCSGDEAKDLEGFANAGDLSLKRAFPVVRGNANWEDGFAFTAPVGSFEPNAFGLHDMHGNVGEWCLDWYDPQVHWTAEPRDPLGPSQPTEWRVVRGGSWYNAPTSCRSSGRHDGIETARSVTNGFRVLIEAGAEARSQSRSPH